MWQTGIKMRRIAGFQFIGFASERQSQAAGKQIDPFFAVVVVMLIPTAGRGNCHANRL
jgi:hypothetical protein